MNDTCKLDSELVAKECEKITKRMKRSQALYMQQINKLKANCNHSKLQPMEYYVDGSYYDKAYTNYWDECVGCGKKLNERHESHGWYG